MVRSSLILLAGVLAVGCRPADTPVDAGADAQATPAPPTVAAPGALDAELSRLAGLVETGRWASDQTRAEFARGDAAYRSAREACGDEAACLNAATANRIAEVRTGFADARSDDGAGVSSGPLALACRGLNYGVSVTTIRSAPDMAVASWMGRSVALSQSQAETGARYTGVLEGQPVALWINGDQARFTPPGGPAEADCRIEEIG